MSGFCKRAIVKFKELSENTILLRSSASSFSGFRSYFLGGKGIILSNVSVVTGSSVFYDRFCYYSELEINSINSIAFDTDAIFLFFFGNKLRIKNYFFLKFKKKSNKYLQDRVIFLTSSHSTNYFHFTFEIFSKLLIIKRYDEFFKDFIIVLDEGIKEVSSLVFCLEFLNLRNRVLFEEKGISYRIKQGIFIFNDHFITPNFRNGYKMLDHEFIYKFNLESIKYHRGVLAGLGLVQSERKIYLERGANYPRSVMNNTELKNFLIKFNFSIVKCEDHTISEQISLFKSASVIIGSSGAAFTNIIYCQPGTNVFVFGSWRENIDPWKALSELLGLRYHYIFCDPIDAEDIHSKFLVDVRSLSVLL